MVEIKQVELKKIEKLDPALYKIFTESLDKLNSYYYSLKNEFDKTPNKEQLLEAMIQNLRLQQELLNQQLSIFQSIKQQKNEKHNKTI